MSVSHSDVEELVHDRRELYRLPVGTRVVDLCRRLLPVGNAVLLPVEGPFVEYPLVSP